MKQQRQQKEWLEWAEFQDLLQETEYDTEWPFIQTLNDNTKTHLLGVLEPWE